MLAYNFNESKEYMGYEELQRDPLEPEKWLYPANSTTIEPPLFDPQAQRCRFDGEKWLVENIFIPEPKLTEEEKLKKHAEDIRMYRDILLNETDKYMLQDYPITEEKREQYRLYRQYLRDIPAAIDFPDIKVMNFQEWIDIWF